LLVFLLFGALEERAEAVSNKRVLWASAGTDMGVGRHAPVSSFAEEVFGTREKPPRSALPLGREPTGLPWGGRSVGS